MTIKVDLLPTERKKFGFDVVWAFLFLLVALCIVAFYFFGVDLENKIKKYDELIGVQEKQIQEIKSQLPQIQDLKAKNQELERQIEMVKMLRYDPIRYGNLLDEISLLIPESMWINSLNIEPGTQSVTMSGTAAQLPGTYPLTTIANFMKELQKSRYFRDASLSNTSRTEVTAGEGKNLVKYNAYTFQIETHYDPKAATGQQTSMTEEKSVGKTEGSVIR